MNRWRHLAVGLAVVAIIVTGLRMYRDTQRRVAFDSTSRLVDRTISEHLCNSTELGQRRVGWLEDYDAAMALARKSKRPIFLVSGDGDLCTGRL
ncbi:MAG: hypothetical protein EB084_05505 [Proteobacteria bacterium]|nr:hypothetical protein [Pseudomonadota bacterium]